MPHYENLDPSPPPSPVSQAERRNRCAYCLLVSMLVTMILSLAMMIVFYITFVEIIETVKNSPIAHVNLKPVNDAFNEITSDEVKQFITNFAYLMRQITVDDIMEFFQGAEKCLEGVCTA